MSGDILEIATQSGKEFCLINRKFKETAYSPEKIPAQLVLHNLTSLSDHAVINCADVVVLQSGKNGLFRPRSCAIIFFTSAQCASHNMRRTVATREF